MKLVKLALLGTAALAAVSVSARADQLSDLKAQIEALNGRIAALEATPSVPAGFMAVSMSKGKIAVPGGQFKGYEHEGTVISILPTADAPEAAATVVSWTGNVKAAFVYQTNATDPFGITGDSFDIAAKAGLNVTGKTETAVGEVGVSFSIAAGGGFAVQGVAPNQTLSGASWNSIVGVNGGNVPLQTDGVKGWWKLTPNVTLLGGQFGSLSGNGKGYDGACTCYFTGDGNGGWGVPPVDPVQMQLAYSDGPIGLAVAIEDGSNFNVVGNVGFAAEVTYSGDMLSAEANFGYQPADGAANSANWDASLGLGAKFDMFSLSAAAGIGHEGAITAVGNDFTKVSAMAKANLGDTAHIEIGASEKWITSGANNGRSNFAAGGGIYYDPVKQLTIGVEAAYNANTIAFPAGNVTKTTFDLVTVFRF